MTEILNKLCGVRRTGWKTGSAPGCTNASACLPP